MIVLQCECVKFEYYISIFLGSLYSQIVMKFGAHNSSFEIGKSVDMRTEGKKERGEDAKLQTNLGNLKWCCHGDAIIFTAHRALFSEIHHEAVVLKQYKKWGKA